VLLLNKRLYGFYCRERGLLFAAACVPLHLLYFLYSGFSYLYVWLELWIRRALPVTGNPLTKRP
jgi:hypothetical protein